MSQNNPSETVDSTPVTTLQGTTDCIPVPNKALGGRISYQWKDVNGRPFTWSQHSKDASYLNCSANARFNGDQGRYFDKESPELVDEFMAKFRDAVALESSMPSTKDKTTNTSTPDSRQMLVIQTDPNREKLDFRAFSMQGDTHPVLSHLQEFASHKPGYTTNLLFTSEYGVVGLEIVSSAEDSQSCTVQHMIDMDVDALTDIKAWTEIKRTREEVISKILPWVKEEFLNGFRSGQKPPCPTHPMSSAGLTDCPGNVQQIYKLRLGDYMEEYSNQLGKWVRSQPSEHERVRRNSV